MRHPSRRLARQEQGGAHLPLVVFALLLGGACPPPPRSTLDAGVTPLSSGAPVAVALAGADLLVLEGSRVQLDGHGARALSTSQPLSLTWSQVAGPAVVLTNPSGPSPAFVAPLSPATLRFRLRAESELGEAFDEVEVRVVDAVAAAPLFLEVPSDAIAATGDEISFSVDLIGDSGGVVLEASAPCAGEPVLRVEGTQITLRSPDELPCVVLVDAVAPDGRRSARAARVLWPAGTQLPSPTRLLAPVLAEPGAFVPLAFEGAAAQGVTLAWPPAGREDGLASAAPGPALVLEAPQRRTRVFVAGERRLGHASGGIRYALIDVSAGAGNRAPVARGGEDRRVRPGASFTLGTGGTYDLDGDPLTLEVVQVLGPPALLDEVQRNVFYAPAEPSVLLFHVRAFDQRVWSEPDSVRVVVDPSVENLEPVLTLDPVRYVSPGRTFVLDASSAYDPDSGFIKSWSIAQDPTDEVQLLLAPVDQPTVALVSQAAGDVYRFRLAAFDEQGLGAFADVEVIVEEAGPYIDALRGDDEEGNGTAAAPKRSLGAALEVAARHQLAELRLATGMQLPFSGTLPHGLSLVGGYVHTDDAYAPGGPASGLLLEAGGLIVSAGSLSQLDLLLHAADALVVLEGRSSLDDVAVSEGPAHEGVLIEVAPAALVSLDRVEVTGTATGAGPVTLVSLKAGSAARIIDSTLLGGAGGTRTGLECKGATLDLIRSDVVGAAGGDDATGLWADSCDVQLLGSRVTGGTAATSAVGLHARETVLFLDALTRVSGAAAGQSESARGLLIEGTDAASSIIGHVQATEGTGSANHAVALEAAGPRVALGVATLKAEGATFAAGLLVRAHMVQGSGASIEATSLLGEAVAVELAAADEVVLSDASLRAAGPIAFGVRAAGVGGVFGPRLSRLDVVVEGEGVGGGIALGASRSVVLEDCEVVVTVPAGTGSIRGVGLADGVLRGGRAEVSGDGPTIGVVVAAGAGAVHLERFTVIATSSAGTAVGVLGNATVELRSSFVRAHGAVSAVGLEARAPARLQHATVLSGGTAVLANASGATLYLVNSALAGDVGVRRAALAPEPLSMSHLALIAPMPLVAPDETVAATEAQIEDAGCVACFVLEDGLFDQDTGRLLPQEDHPLVDKGSLSFVVTFDIDGEERPFGPLPDLGCDERWPED
jgi:hypothetical protein